MRLHGAEAPAPAARFRRRCIRANRADGTPSWGEEPASPRSNCRPVKSPSLIPHAPLALAFFLSALVFSLAAAQAPPARQPAPARGAKRGRGIIAFSAADHRWSWLQDRGDTVELLERAGDGAARSLGSDPHWVDLAADGDDLWVLRRDGGRGTLFGRHESSGPVAEVAPALSSPGGLRAAGGTVYWIESESAPTPVLPYVAALAGAAHLRSLTPGGRPRTLATWWGGTAPGPGDLIEVDPPFAYVRVRRDASTEFLRIPLAGGDAVRLAAEDGPQEGVASNGAFYWTSDSEEGNRPGILRCVHRLGPDGTRETVTDWLPGAGTLHSTGRGLVYLAVRTNAGEYEVPSHLALPRLVRELPGASTLDGAAVILLETPDAPRVAPETSH